MKYFHKIIPTAFATHVVSGGEYTNLTFDRVRESAAIFAKFLDYPLDQLLNLLEDDLSGRVMVFPNTTTPAEERMITEYAVFARWVLLTEGSWDRDTRIFTCHNLNDGTSFVWVHYVC